MIAVLSAPRKESDMILDGSAFFKLLLFLPADSHGELYTLTLSALTVNVLIYFGCSLHPSDQNIDKFDLNLSHTCTF